MKNLLNILSEVKMSEKDNNKDPLEKEKEDETPSVVGVVDLHELITEQHSIG